MMLQSTLQAIKAWRAKRRLSHIPGYASAAHSEALARSKHKKVRQHQKDKTRALHEALAGLKRVDEPAPKRHPLLDDWARVEADWVTATGCRED